jgi:glucose-1-phosphate thymidylyltransferase
MKGIVLAGGTGTRLHPITKGISKQLIPIYDKPMVYYPISVLMLAGIRDILIITTPEDIFYYQRLLGDGSNFGINLSYIKQEKPEGLGQAFILGEEFIGSDKVSLVLGDNIFFGQGLTDLLSEASGFDGATVFGYKVQDPSRYGIVELDDFNNALSIEEKPTVPKSNIAVTGLYFYDNNVVDIAKNIKKSLRGEYEITSINNAYLEQNQLKVQILGRGFAWLDTGTNQSLLAASSFVEAVQTRQGYMIACLEEIAFNNGWIKREQLQEIAKVFEKVEYGKYLSKILEETL